MQHKLCLNIFNSPKIHVNVCIIWRIHFVLEKMNQSGAYMCFCLSINVKKFPMQPLTAFLGPDVHKGRQWPQISLYLKEFVCQ